MVASTLINYAPPTDPDHVAATNALLAANGIDLSRVLTLGMRDNRLLPRVYHNTDVGLFPNRVEGGTNMLLMEYMACGKPAIAAFNSGHKDILSPHNAVLITKHRQCSAKTTTTTAPHWNEPDLDETIAHLEACYQDRNRLPAIGAQAAKDMTSFTWKRVAEKLLAAVHSVIGSAS